jgi:two-component system, LytTR family, sensor kinase
MHKTIRFYRVIYHSAIVLVFIVALPILLIHYGTLGMKEMHARDLPIEPQAAFLRWVIFTAFLIPFYFLNVYFLVPRYIKTRRYTPYVIIILSFIVCNALINFVITYFTVDMPPKSFFEPIVFLPMIMLIGLGTSFEMVLNWHEHGLQQEQVEKEKIAAELSFLKIQVSPHFFFNTLNNIYSLSEIRSPKTGTSILMLANLMRYMLYETNHGKIQLTRELNHLEEYISLQSLRLPSDGTVVIAFEKEGALEGVLIEPLIFICFIENAFKHGISYDYPSYIRMHFGLKKNELVFSIQNSKKAILTSRIVDRQSSGIGISNTKRRLSLLYPDRHRLVIDERRDYYQVVLKIQLNGSDFENHRSSENKVHSH